MKKLCTLFFCCAVLALPLAAKPLMDFPKAVEDQVNSVQTRVVTLQAWIANSPKDSVRGKAVLLGFDSSKTHMELLLSQSLTTEIDVWEDADWIGQIAQGAIMPAVPAALQFENAKVTGKHLYKVILPVNLNARQRAQADKITTISVQEALPLLGK